jgi:hypothetical protein
MIELLGPKRAVLLAALIIVNLLVAGAYFGVILPMKEEADSRLTSTKNEISRLQTEIQNIKAELQSLKEAMPRYEALEDKGFFLGQDRFFLSRALQDIKNRSQLRGFAFAIQDIREVPSNDAMAANRRLVASKITINQVSSLLDTAFFDFMNIIESYFPSHARIASFSVSKSGDVDSQALERIAKDPGASLVNASLTMDWLTMTDIPPPPAPETGVP